MEGVKNIQTILFASYQTEWNGALKKKKTTIIGLHTLVLIVYVESYSILKAYC